MYGDQFGEFVCGYWGLEGLIRTIYQWWRLDRNLCDYESSRSILTVVCVNERNQIAFFFLCFRMYHMYLFVPSRLLVEHVVYLALLLPQL